MKIVSWNCHGKFREKYRYLQRLDADIYVIQECENPDKYRNHFSCFYTNYFWYGEKDNKGLGIFAKPSINMSLNNWPVYCLRHFVSVRINDSFDLLGVWACAPYIEEYCIYQAINIDKYNSKTIIIGDFNSNAIWDKKHGKRNHGTVVAQLAEKNIVSAYHHITGEQHGFESQNTFCLYGHSNKKYHIDYCFTAARNIENFRILSDSKWLEISDHLPLLCEYRFSL